MQPRAKPAMPPWKKIHRLNVRSRSLLDLGRSPQVCKNLAVDLPSQTTKSDHIDQNTADCISNQ
jgi:hypothetical protein